MASRDPDGDREDREQPGLVTCPPDCRAHREHVYILCYGQRVIIKNRDYLLHDPAPNHPISHYVAHTRQQPPVKQIRSHGAHSERHIAQIRPGRAIDANKAKDTEACPKCGGSLWYYGESPNWPPR